MEQFRIVAACEACKALHVVTGLAPAGALSAVVITFSCRSCRSGYCRTPIPADYDLPSLEIELKPIGPKPL